MQLSNRYKFSLKRVQTEYQHWLRLQPSARKMLVAFLFFELALPIVFVFSNAFLFRSSSDFRTLAWYNVGWFITVVASFYANGFLMRRFSITKLLGLGALGQGLVVFLLFGLSDIVWWKVFGFGLLNGIPIGMFWSNRHFLELSLTENSNRNYYHGLVSLLVTFSEFVTPLSISSFMAVVFATEFISINQAYQALGLVTVLLLAVSGWLVQGVQVDVPRWKKLWLGRVKTSWNKVRAGIFLHGVTTGARMMFPTLLVFVFLGNEVELGLLQAVSTALVAGFSYTYARKSKEQHRKVVLTTALSALILVQILFAISANTLTALLYYTAIGLGVSVVWLAWLPLQQFAIDQEDGGSPDNNYAYVADQELLLNIGRIFGIGVFFMFIGVFSQVGTLRAMAVFLSIVQFMMIFAVHQVDASLYSSYNGIARNRTASKKTE